MPGAGPDIEDDCKTAPSTGDCELVDKVLYRDGDAVDLTPLSYEALKDLFSDEMGDDLSDHYPVAVTFDFAVEGTTTTTTSTTTTTTTTSTSTTTTTTTTTTLPTRPCGDPVALVARFSASGAGESRAVVASDALFVLRAAVGSETCALCTCDVNNSGSVSAPDALLVLRKAVGQDVLFACPPCFVLVSAETAAP